MYQPESAPNPYTPLYTGHYPNQYPAANASIPAPIPYFPPYQPQQAVKPTPAPEVQRPDPTEPSVTPQIASRAMQRLVTAELQNAGFQRAVQPAVQRLCSVVQQLFQRAHEYANLANRASAIASDVLLACGEFDITPQELYQVKKGTHKRKRGQSISSEQAGPVILIPVPSRSPSPELLASDDEDDIPSTVPATLRNLPTYFPDLPPKHTYLQTPASPPKKAALPSLEKKLKTAALVQESLQHLLLATEDNMNHEEGELLGHVVNWETNIQPRKRWRVGAKY